VYGSGTLVSFSNNVVICTEGKIYDGRVARCPLANHGNYADEAEKQTDGHQTVTLRFPLDAVRVITDAYKTRKSIIARRKPVLQAYRVYQSSRNATERTDKRLIAQRSTDLID